MRSSGEPWRTYDATIQNSGGVSRNIGSSGTDVKLAAAWVVGFDVDDSVYMSSRSNSIPGFPPTQTMATLSLHNGKWTHELLIGLLLLASLPLLGCDSRIRPNTPEGVALYTRSSPVIPVDQVGQFEWIYAHEVEDAEEFYGRLVLTFDPSVEMLDRVLDGTFDLRIEVEAYALTDGAPPRSLLDDQPVRVLDQPAGSTDGVSYIALTGFLVSKDRIRVVVRVTTPDAEWAKLNPRLKLGPVYIK